MGMNFGAMMKMMSAWNKFKTNHPKFPAFVSAVSRKGIQPDTIIAITITDPYGEKIETNIKVTESDIELFNALKDQQ